MFEYFRRHPLSTSDVLALVGIAVTILLAAIGPIRRWIARRVRAFLLRAGRPERKYAAWFVGKWGEYENPYLADVESLDLSNTFVSLSFRAPGSRQETTTVATRMLADRDAGNLIVEGAPGSGKSTLLRAYGVGALKMRHYLIGARRRSGSIPFFVQLRKFAGYQHKTGLGLAEYLTAEILISGAGMAREDAADFLQYALTEQRAVVMLDGLDEVSADRHASVLEAVYGFANDQNPTRPTHLARLIVTCRRQNFLTLRDQWVPAVAQTVCTLAPLRNSEIFSYLNKLRVKFRNTDGPESFFQALRASGTLELHRVPLILAMSVGLYARKEFFEIPNSITKLYQTMILEMLDRQQFKRDPGGGELLKFKVVDDKYRFLREFALASALGPRGFDDFERADLIRTAEALAPDLSDVADPRAFVTEIIDRAGLLSDVSEAGHFVFAHRSIHEYLAAEELLLRPDGATLLLDRAADPEWRQVILFYTTAQEQRSVDGFLRELVGRNTMLAGHCLAGAKASDAVATVILDALGGATPADLAAVVAATMSPRRRVQELAINQLETQLLTYLDHVADTFDGDVDGMLPLLGSLAGSNAGRIAALVPRIVANIPDDPRLVEPLWRCLATPGIEDHPAARTIVERLLEMAMEPDGMTELQRQEAYLRSFLDRTARREAYPFVAGLPPDSNMVTLLAWAHYLNVEPDVPNRFFAAKIAGRLRRLEDDKHRTVEFSLFWTGRVITAAATLISVVVAGVLLLRDWHVLLRPFGGWSVLLMFGCLVAPFVVALLSIIYVEDHPERARSHPRLSVLGMTEGERSHIAGGSFPNSVVGNIIVGVMLFAGPLSYPVATAPLAGVTVSGYLAAALIGPLLVFYLPITDLFSKRRFYLYRPNPYVDAYDDPRSRHWLVPASAQQPPAG